MEIKRAGKCVVFSTSPQRYESWRKIIEHRYFNDLGAYDSLLIDWRAVKERDNVEVEVRSGL